MNNLSTISKRSSLVFIAKVFGMMFGLLLNFLAARLLGADEYGKFIYIYNFLVYISIILSLGLHQGLIYFIPKYSNNISKRNSVLILSILTVVGLSIIMVFSLITNAEVISRIVLNNSDLKNLLIMTSPIVIFTTTLLLYQGIFSGLFQVKKFIIIEQLFIPLIKIISFIILAFFTLKASNLVFAFYFGTITGVLGLSIHLVNLKVFSVKISELFSYVKSYKDVLKYSFPLLLTGFLSILLQRTDLYMIGYLINERSVGVYNIALKIGTISSFALTAVNIVFAPEISRLFNENKLEELKLTFSHLTKYIFFVNLVVFALILTFSTELMSIFGEEYIIGAGALVLISIGEVFNAGVGSVGFILSMTGRVKTVMYTNLLATIINITLNFLLIPIYGIHGAAFASFISISILNLSRLLYVYKYYKLHPYTIQFFYIFMAVSIPFLAMFILKYVIRLNGILEMICLSILFVIVVLVIIWHLIMSKDDKKIILDIINKKEK